MTICGPGFGGVTFTVMGGLVPAISRGSLPLWMAGTGQDRPGHDGNGWLHVSVPFRTIANCRAGAYQIPRNAELSVLVGINPGNHHDS